MWRQRREQEEWIDESLSEASSSFCPEDISTFLELQQAGRKRDDCKALGLQKCVSFPR